MRLLNTSTLEFEEYLGVPTRLDDEKGYAILSHRWSKDEVSLQDWLDGKKRDGAGYAKVVEFCSLAKKNGYQLAWVDTCCIDKKSSAELSEAINSMSEWYQNSDICYVYMDDISLPSEATEQRIEQAFWESAWWTRGWTLQELLEPFNIEFYDVAWNKIGDKKSLSTVIVQVSGIDSIYLSDPREIAEASIATRMSWASQRITTRPEDITYCLLGLFNVNMALLYGEGARKAFTRLQLEIIKKSYDQSIFAWSGGPKKLSGMLASGPDRFERSSGKHRIVLERPIFEQKPYSMTNRGLKIRLPFVQAGEGCRYVLLHCCAGCEREFAPPGVFNEDQEWHKWLAVRLLKASNDQWVRDTKVLFTTNPKAYAIDSEAMFVKQRYV